MPNTTIGTPHGILTLHQALTVTMDCNMAIPIAVCLILCIIISNISIFKKDVLLKNTIRSQNEQETIPALICMFKIYCTNSCLPFITIHYSKDCIHCTHHILAILHPFLIWQFYFDLNTYSHLYDTYFRF